jgi:hypothetical protein
MSLIEKFGKMRCLSAIWQNRAGKSQNSNARFLGDFSAKAGLSLGVLVALLIGWSIGSFAHNSLLICIIRTAGEARNGRCPSKFRKISPCIELKI